MSVLQSGSPENERPYGRGQGLLHTVENLTGPGPGHRNSRIFYFSFDRSFISSLRISYSFSHIHPLFQLHPDPPPSTHPTDFFSNAPSAVCAPEEYSCEDELGRPFLPCSSLPGWNRVEAPSSGEAGYTPASPEPRLSASGGDTGPAGSEAPRPGGPRERSPHAGSAGAGWGRRGLPGPRCTPADRVRPQGISWSSLSPTATSPTGRSAYGS